MGNKKKPLASTGADRKARVEALKRQQKASERKKTIGLIAIAIVVGGALIAVPTISILNDRDEAARAIASYGVPLALAGCDPVQTDEVADSDGEHNTDAAATIEYENAPPSQGPHFASPATINTRGFYTPDDTPRVEELVHNLEHGYTIAWYLPSVSGDQLDALRGLAGNLRDDNETRKFIAAPWDPERGEFPAGKTMALTHWGAPTEAGDYATSSGYRRYCAQVSGEAAAAFINEYPASDSPEPNTP